MEQPKTPDAKQPRIIYVNHEFLSHIESGNKTLELRIKFNSFSRIKAGDILDFRDSSDKSIKVKVNEIREHSSLIDVLDNEDFEKIAPGMSKLQAEQAIKKFFKEEDIATYGFIVIDFEKV